MINNIEFSERLRKLLSYYDISAAGIAEILGIQRSTMSHLLSGRNKPSLDVVLKILKHYPEVELYWLINGQGDFPKIIQELKEDVSTPNIAQQQKISFQNDTDDPQDLPEPILKNITKKEIDRIVIFYTDGTFSHYNSES